MHSLIEDVEVKFGEDFHVLYFYLAHTPFHSLLMGLIEKIERDIQISVIAVDVEYFEGLCRRFEIKSVPTFLSLKDGKIIHRLTGVPTFAQLSDICLAGDTNEKGK